MKWLILPKIGSSSPGILWFKDFLSRFDTSKVDWVRVDYGRAGRSGVYGRCWYPHKDKNFRISCQVPGPYPYTIYTHQKPLYRQADGKFPSLPEGMRAGAHVVSYNKGKETAWIRVQKPVILANQDEAIVWLGAHEAFHFLRKTKQVPGRNTEVDADMYANERLKEWLTS